MSSKSYRRWAAKQERRVNGRIGSMSRDQIIAFFLFVAAVSFASFGWMNQVGIILKIAMTIFAGLAFLAGVAMVINDPDWDEE